ncbi:MAG: DUF2459 domain-containing protein [Brevundimonas sp.]|uniref:DUF2459 domain-containing protein n=1 Tax=Brevundimonas sp. TaxID=1871086 RepID=UPI0040340652
MRLSLIAGLVGLILALATWVRPGAPEGPDATGPDVPVHVLDNGFHTDFVMPRTALASRPGPLKTAVDGLTPGDWILVGWGDAKFYVDQRPIGDRLPDGARAFFRPGGNPSVLMLRPETRPPEVAFLPQGQRRLVLSPAAFANVRSRLERSLDLSTGRPRVAATRPGDPARFFASSETFSILHLCNHWAAEVLNAGGLPIRPVWSITSGEVGATVDRATPPTPA